jgi:sortase (surface protein transpeptidase)
MKFRLKNDWYIDNFFDKVKIYDEGQIFTPDEEGNYTIIGIDKTQHFMKFDEMLNAKSGDELLFEPLNEDELNLIVEEIPVNGDDDVKKWRIQLDVNTSLNKLKLIQKFLQENIPDLL